MRYTIMALLAAGAVSAASPTLANDTQRGLSQATDFSSTRYVVDRRYHHRHNCRTVVVKRWSHGHKIVKRTRVCR